ncbi:DUF1287 domain-containing protein [Adlercreutzia sp. R21]|uniref:DUF1287 domain-containing protein n=1 Tax=Adlercreutzia wanghongyangiae TaxID=3111451 RepID=UPI002DBE86F0|nr:DUF1287 domain-containing protein [Adlercreutzia sp. R21]MEC4184415.1 DUF1287 domain-containing protein [Adlercreutzia sp. R21]
MGRHASRLATRKRSRAPFVAVAVVLAVLVLAGGVFIGFREGPLQHTSAEPLPDVYEPAMVIEPFQSSHDEDGDGIDDQTDVLASAEAYVATNPKYKSAYYAETGYPDDGFGVCTDVIAQALKGTGYDLMALLAADVQENPEAYGISEPDAAIDFRRVRNQKVFFDRHAVSLTCDTSDPAQWHGGDIVVYNEHVGIASGRRNAQGLPYLIHHYSPTQATYEEDALESWGPIIGHYRISE